MHVPPLSAAPSLHCKHVLAELHTTEVATFFPIFLRGAPPRALTWVTVVEETSSTLQLRVTALGLPRPLLAKRPQIFSQTILALQSYNAPW